jgi:peptide/nickel transport system permease protein
LRRVRRFLRNGQVLAGLVIVGLFVAVAILAPQLAPPEDPDNPSTTRVVGKYYDPIPHAPNQEALLGTAPGQVDIYYSLVWGTRSALALGLTVTVSTALIGILLGALSGYAGGVVLGLTLRVTDAFLAFPVIAGVWLLQQVLMPASPFGDLSPIQQAFFDLGLSPILLTLIVFSWMPYARLTSANIMQLKQTEYVQAARSIGVRKRRIIGRHLLPNALPPVIVLGARDVGAMVILTTAFTFIGLGGSTEWGAVLVTSRDYIIGSSGNPLTYWWVFVPTTLALILFGIGWNLLGDGLNTVLDPRISRR